MRPVLEAAALARAGARRPSRRRRRSRVASVIRCARSTVAIESSCTAWRRAIAAATSSIRGAPEARRVALVRDDVPPQRRDAHHAGTLPEAVRRRLLQVLAILFAVWLAAAIAALRRAPRRPARARRRRGRAPGLEDAAAGRLRARAGRLRAAAARLARLEARARAPALRRRDRSSRSSASRRPRPAARRGSSRGSRTSGTYAASTWSRRSSTSSARAGSSSAATTASCAWSARGRLVADPEVHGHREPEARLPDGVRARLLAGGPLARLVPSHGRAKSSTRRVYPRPGGVLHPPPTFIVARAAVRRNLSFAKRV